MVRPDVGPQNLFRRLSNVHATGSILIRASSVDSFPVVARRTFESEAAAHDMIKSGSKQEGVKMLGDVALKFRGCFLQPIQ